MRTAVTARPVAPRWPAILRAPQKLALAAYVGSIIAIGATLLVVAAPRSYPQPWFALLLVIAATALSMFKLQLPLNKGASNMSLAYAVDFVALLLGSVNLAIAIAAAAVIVQSTARVRRSYPVYRVAFNVAAVVIALRIAGGAWTALGGNMAELDVVTTLLPLSAAAVVYFAINTMLIAQAVALSTSAPIRLAWRDFVWSAPSYFVSAIVALIVSIVIRNQAYLLLPFAILPLYISYRAYAQSVKRLAEERSHAEQLAETAAAAQEALARAVNSEAALAAEKERLALQTARLGATLRTIGDGVVSVNESGAVLLMNEAAEALTTLPRSERLDQHVGAIFEALGYAPDVVAQALHRVLIEGCPLELRHDNAGRSVLRRLVDVTGTPTRDADGHVTGAVWVIRDVSDAARLELERSRAARLESLGVLAGGLAHDFNNILVGVVGNLSLAQAMVRRDDATLGARLAEAEAACVRARGVTNQLLTFAKGGAPVKTTASIRELVVECARFALSGSPVAPRFAIDGDVWAADVDVTQIGQVIHNLVLNAMQAMPRGGVVNISLGNVAVGGNGQFPAVPVPPGDYVRLTVHDSGPGIRPEHIGRIFDPYFTTKEKGSGLGLAISYSIVRAHGGAITVDSPPADGCRFDVYLPASGHRDVAVRPQAQAAQQTRPGRILLMDDDVDVVDVTSDMLKMIGYEVETAASGEQAIERFAVAEAGGSAFDMVILDLTVPGGMGGADAVPQIRALRPTVPVVVTSGYADDAVLARFRSFGFDGVLPKPFGLADLTRALQQAEANAAAARHEAIGS